MLSKRYKLMSISVMALVILLMGCTKIQLSKETIGEKEETTTPLTIQKEGQDITQVIADLEWELIMTEEKELSDGTYIYPTTSLFLKSKTNAQCRIDLKHVITGNYFEEKPEEYLYPKDAYLPLINWYAGGGESIMIKLEDKSSFYVMMNPLAEGTPDYEGRGVSASWEDYKPIAKVNYVLDEKGKIESLTCETYEVDYSSFFEDDKALPLEMEWAIWERKTTHGPSSWYRIYLMMESNRKEEVDLGLYLCQPEIINKENIKGINLPPQTEQVLKGKFEDQGILTEAYFIVYKEEDLLKVDYVEMHNGEQVQRREIYGRSLAPEQELKMKEINYLEKPYRVEGSYHPVVYNNYLLGGSKNGINYSYVEMCHYMEQEESYKLYTLEKGYIKDTDNVKFTLKQDNVINSSGYRGEVTIDKQTPYFGVCGYWEAMPRIPKKQDSVGYQKFFPEGVILQNYRIDLEGDGQEEVVLVIQEAEEIYLVLRKIGADGEVYTLKESMNKNTLGDVKLVGIADVQGDGIMEIIVESEEWGNPGYKVYTPNESYFTEVFGDIEDIHCWH